MITEHLLGKIFYLKHVLSHEIREIQLINLTKKIKFRAAFLALNVFL